MSTRISIVRSQPKKMWNGVNCMLKLLWFFVLFLIYIKMWLISFRFVVVTETASRLAIMIFKVLPMLVRRRPQLQQFQAPWMMWSWWMGLTWAKKCPHEFCKVCHKKLFTIRPVVWTTVARQAQRQVAMCSRRNHTGRLNRAHIVQYSQHPIKHHNHLDHMLNMRTKADPNIFALSKAFYYPSLYMVK